MVGDGVPAGLVEGDGRLAERDDVSSVPAAARIPPPSAADIGRNRTG
ncbi:hypothetical protein STXM2123_5133 [Streptomyces sp. F-3]|nr:hypothetical protein STXM2123_5133 [Streptomyces sp. F-3]